MTAPDAPEATSGDALLATVTQALESATPGPWEWEHEAGNEVTVAVSSLAGPAVLCRYWPRTQAKNAEADAHLIAHAPEWLAALVALVEATRVAAYAEGTKAGRLQVADLLERTQHEDCWNVVGKFCPERCDSYGIYCTEAMVAYLRDPMSPTIPPREPEGGNP